MFAGLQKEATRQLEENIAVVIKAQARMRGFLARKYFRLKKEVSFVPLLPPLPFTLICLHGCGNRQHCMPVFWPLVLTDFANFFHFFFLGARCFTTMRTFSGTRSWENASRRLTWRSNANAGLQPS